MRFPGGDPRGDRPEVQWIHVVGLRKQGLLEPAVSVLREILKGEPNHDLALMEMGTIAGEVGDYPAAISYLEKAIEVQEGPSADVLTNLGMALRKGGKPNEAITAYLRALEVDDRSLSAKSGLGLAYAAKEDFVAALECFADAVKLAPDDVTQWRNLVTAMIELEKFDEALLALDRVETMSPESGMGQLYRAAIQLLSELPQRWKSDSSRPSDCVEQR